MWYILQTLKHKETEKPVIYLGIDCDNPKESSVITKTSEGEIIKGETTDFTEYKDQEGNIKIGKHAINEFFGIVKREYWKKYNPDLDIIS